jgi:catechol 2,3-dioxygenase-like lactoylglutathione lyase family enzyme
MVPVADQDAAIAFYTGTLGFSLVADRDHDGNHLMMVEGQQ